jgi:hypothetical protein
MHRVLVLVPVMIVLAACKPVPAMKEFAYPAWGFVASFWAPPQLTETPASPEQPHTLLLESKEAGRDFAVSVMEGVRPGVSIDQIGPDYVQRAAKAMDDEVGAETYTSTAQGVLGREYALTKNGKPDATIRAYLANGRFYEVAAQSPLGPDDPAVKDYLDRFRITTAPPAVPPPQPANAAPASGAG